MQTTAGMAFGTQVNSPTYDDSTAVLTGEWGPDQFVQAKVKIVNPCNATDYEEVELRTNSTISAHSITGTSLITGVAGEHRPTRSSCDGMGRSAIFTYLANNGVHGAKYAVHDGDVITATSLRNGAGCPVLTLLNKRRHPGRTGDRLHLSERRSWHGNGAGFVWRRGSSQ